MDDIVVAKGCIEVAEKAVVVGGKAVDIYDDHKDRVIERKDKENTNQLRYAEDVIDTVKKELQDADETIHNAGDSVIAFLQESTRIWKEIKSHIHIKDHGSKVKEGIYAESSIDDVGHVRIIIDKSHKHDVLLTPEHVMKCEYLKEKERDVAMKKKMYYYYRVTFVDNQICYIRINKKIREILQNTIEIT